ELRHAEGQHVERRARRGDAAAADELDLRGAEKQLLAHAQANLVSAVGDGGGALALELARRPTGASRKISSGAHIPVAAGRCDHRSARIDARADSLPVVDSLLQREG